MVTFRDKMRFTFYFVVIVGLLLWMVKILSDIKIELQSNHVKQDHIISILEKSPTTPPFEMTTNPH